LSKRKEMKKQNFGTASRPATFENLTRHKKLPNINSNKEKTQVEIKIKNFI